jgi:hypothetical protein
MSKPLPLFAGLLAIALCGGQAFAQSADKDKDKNKMSKKEQQAQDRKQWETMFKEHDKNNDRGLQKSEVGDKAFPHIRDHFAEMDTNKDGKVTMAEHDAWEKKQNAKERAAKAK